MTESASDPGVDSEVDPYRILYFDVETSPMLAYVWSAKADYIPHNQILHESFLFCWAAKWSDQKTIKSDKLTPEEVADKDDGRIAGSLGDLVRQADLVVAHNGDRFDVPRLSTRLLLSDQEPLGPVHSVDTLKLARRSFGFSHNRLDHLAQQLGLGKKIKTDFDLWESVYNGDEGAMQQMVRYCKHDVDLLEQVFTKIRPHVKNLGRMVDAVGESCPNCGSHARQKRGYLRTNAYTYQRYQCTRCGRYHKGERLPRRAPATRPL